MKFQRISLYIIGTILVLPLFTIIFGNQTALAYKCTGQTDNLQHYYRDGACYQPVGTVCLDNPPPSNITDCKNRDTSKDTKVTNEKPVKNDGSEVTEWQCASGTYNATKNVCETCNSFGNCQTNTKVTPTPKGDDTTKDPTDTTGDSTTSGGDTEGGGAGKCAGEKTDFFACGADGSDAIVGILKIIILIVSVGVGVVAVGGIVYGAILYSSAQDNQDQVRRSIKVIRNVIIGLLLYIFMITIINFLVPGGVFGGTSPAPEATNNGNTQNTNSSNTNNSQNSGNNQQNNNNSQNQN